jgi:NAD(P)-dependent dehydrogenase (short-subunit alcohol dehydrogenase family)
MVDLLKLHKPWTDKESKSMVNSESNGKVALITGANKGLGFEMSRQLAQQEITVLIAARKLEAAEELEAVMN